MNDENKKNISLSKPLKERKISDKQKQQYNNIDYDESINILRNYYIPREEYLDKNKYTSLVSSINKKLNSYKQQDIHKYKYNETDFIVVEEVINKLLTGRLICYYCNEKTRLFYTYSREPKQWTLERIDNSIGHTNKNTVIACLDCNLKRRDRSSKDFKFAKQLVIKKV